MLIRCAGSNPPIRKAGVLKAKPWSYNTWLHGAKAGQKQGKSIAVFPQKANPHFPFQSGMNARIIGL